MDQTAAKPATKTAAEQLFNQFHKSTDFLEILSSFQTLCSDLGLERSGQYVGFYPALKEKLTTWRTKSLYPLLDAKAALPEYENQHACAGQRVLIVGAGPIGLRAAIEAALLGATVDVVEKRTHFSRNNCVHLWPFVVADLRNLGAKVFYSKLGAGGIDHICIRILQTILLKICLLFGVRVHPGIKFTGLVEPDEDNGGWSVSVSSTPSPVSSNNYDIILAADGKQSSLPGFHSKEYRPNLALAITANFVRHSTRSEAVIPEFGELSFIARQTMFRDMVSELDIDLENIVYFKDESHYFVMTARKPSLLKRGVIKEDQSHTKQLLAKENIDREALEKYAVDAATFSTKGALGQLEFEKNHEGESDVALFDFSTMYISENASRIVERKGKRLLLCVAGDSLVEPFWPIGTGIGRGFLGAFDAVWMMKRFSAGDDPMEVLKEREAIMTVLPYIFASSSPREIAKYTINPRTRYANFDSLTPAGDISHLFDSDDPSVAGKADDSATDSSRVSNGPTELEHRQLCDVEPAAGAQVEDKSSTSATSEAHQSLVSPKDN